jgi:2,3-bisphosphoglycerate-independent phosphoglycerate mutase
LRGGGTYPLVTLVILDGWGCAQPGPGNAVELADTPVFDDLWRRFPHTTLSASGEDVGLPPGQMGNSEVGHLTIGAGRVVLQDLMRINRSIANGDFFENRVLLDAFKRARERQANVHLLGLVSYGGVHSHIDHLRALLELAQGEDMADRTFVHAFTDGRDVSPTSAINDLPQLVEEGARFLSVSGRYYAMDRDGRWERTEEAYDGIFGRVEAVPDVRTLVELSYGREVTDEFIRPTATGPPIPGPTKEDALVFFNFRPDRARQLTQRFLDDGFDLTARTSTVRSRSRSRTSLRRWRRRLPSTASGSCTWRRRRSTRTSPTSSTAVARTSGRARPASSSLLRKTWPRTTRSQRCRRPR